MLPILRNTLLMKLIENNTTRRKDLVLLSITKSVTGFSSIFPVAPLVVLTTREVQPVDHDVNDKGVKQ